MIEALAGLVIGLPVGFGLLFLARRLGLTETQAGLGLISLGAVMLGGLLLF